MKLTNTDQLLHQAQQAFEQYRNTSGKDRSAFLRSIASEIEAVTENLVVTAQQESSLPEVRIRGEIGRTTNQLRSFATLIEKGEWVQATIDTADAERKPVPKPDLRKMFFPVGPIIVFGASNFPLAFSTAGGDTASALAAGCSVIVKSHPAHPQTSKLVADAISRSIVSSNMPEFVFQHLNDPGIEAGQHLVLHPLTKGVAFTGSFQGGKALFDLALSRREPIPVFAEMGSINPVLVLPEFLDKNKTFAEGLAAAVLQGVGQFCTNPGLILTVECEGLQFFLDEFGKQISKSSPEKMLHRGTADSYKKGKLKTLSQQNVRTVAAVDEGDEGTGAAAVATVTASEFIENALLHEEVFGPFSLVVRCNDINELKEVIKHLPGQLTASVFGTSSDQREYSSIIRRLQQFAGRVIFGNMPTGADVVKAMHHGGPYPATTDARFTSVGNDAIYRFVRPVCYQNAPEEFLPAELINDNPLNILRCVNNEWTRNKINVIK
jgi:alpha-ketoglutaric semialdehyde dehydrogenase